MSTVLSADGTPVDYDSYGAGPAIVFVAGASQHRAIDRRTGRLARQLGQLGYRAIDYDRRGRGRSGDTAPWSPAREVEDLGALIEVIGGTATVYTASSGAAIGLAAASSSPGAVTGLVLYEPPLFRGRDQRAALLEMRRLFALDRREDMLRYNLTSILTFPPERVDVMAREKSWWQAMVSVGRTLLYDLELTQEINTDPDWRARWSTVRARTAVLSGDSSYSDLHDAADEVAAALPDAHRRVVPGQAHGPKPEAVLPELLRILPPAGGA